MTKFDFRPYDTTGSELLTRRKTRVRTCTSPVRFSTLVSVHREAVNYYTRLSQSKAVVIFPFRVLSVRAHGNLINGRVSLCTGARRVACSRQTHAAPKSPRARENQNKIARKRPSTVGQPWYGTLGACTRRLCVPRAKDEFQQPFDRRRSTVAGIRGQGCVEILPTPVSVQFYSK